MRCICEKENLLKLVLPQFKFDSNEEYRLFTYVLILKLENAILLFNTLTSHMIELSIEEYESINNEETNLFKYLIENAFFVPKANNDLKLKEQLFDFKKSFMHDKSIYEYVILTTTDCNARCFYCFEAGAKHCTMTLKTASDVADFIIKNHNGKKVGCKWFGGEPLYNSEAIDVICKKLEDHNVDFRSTMISNGYLFDDILIEKAKKLWKLENVQITLDGTESIYNRCKNYIYKTEESPYKRVISNIEKLALNDIHVLIRLNLDIHNANDLKNLIHELQLKFKNLENKITVYTYLLYEGRGNKARHRDTNEYSNLMQQLIKIEDKINNSGFGLKSKLSGAINLYNCHADHDGTVIVLPDGRLGKCDHVLDDGHFGNIYSDEVDNSIIDFWKEKKPMIKQCVSCPVAPLCAKIAHCPEDQRECDKFTQEILIRKTKAKMKNSYNDYINSQQTE